jgi:20S proteasome subunit beta 2
MGSGSLAALAVLETGYKDELNEEQAIELVADAIQAGIFHDLGSGSGVNIFSLNSQTKETKKLYGYRDFNKTEFKDQSLFDFKNKNQVLSRTNYEWKDIIVEKVDNSNLECL